MSLLYAQSVPVSGGGVAAFLPFLLIGLIFYFLILRPQSKQKKEYDIMLNGLKKGDAILTRGGIYGKIINFQGKNDYKVIVKRDSQFLNWRYSDRPDIHYYKFGVFGEDKLLGYCILKLYKEDKILRR